MKRKLLLYVRNFWRSLRLMRTSKYEMEKSDWTVQRGHLEYQLERAASTLDTVKSGIDRVIPKLIRARYGIYHRNQRFLIQLELDLMSMSRGFAWGDDDQILQAASERIGRMLYRELKTVNLHRFEDEIFHPLGGRFFSSDDPVENPAVERRVE